MANFNQVILIGRLTADPELKQTPNGTSVTSFSLAVNRDFKREGDPEADFFTVKAFGQTAEFACKYFGKGRAALVIGEVQNRKWTDKQGNNRITTEILASRIKFADSKNADQSGAQAPASAPTSARAQGEFVEVEPGGADNDLPF